jgi:anti-sigma regulatory factor (Ser/Thr protein kinase)
MGPDPDPAPLRHSAYIYDDADDYITRTVAFLREGLAASEGCIVAQARDRLAMTRDALGPDADRVAFVDVGSTYTRPARALASYYEVLQGQLQKARSVRAVADAQFISPREEWEEWMAYEALTNLAYAHLPAWVVCTYDANLLPDAVVDDVWSTHAEMLTGGWVASDCFEDPRDLVSRLTPEPEPLPELRSFLIGDDLGRFRERLARELVAEKIPEAKALEMLVAATEIAANAVRHGGGIAQVRVGSAYGRFVCEVIDRGMGFDDPAAGYLVPREGVGAGLWIARQLTWEVQSFRSPRGFTVRTWL